MSSITGAGNYGGSYNGGGDGKYGSYNNKSYSDKYSGSYGTKNSDYQVGLGAYGNYSFNKSTLDKYKDKDKGNNSNNSKGSNNNIPDITGAGNISNSVSVVSNGSD